MAGQSVKNLFWITYRAESDNLFATVVPTVAAESEEIARDFYFRIADGKIVGFECIDFSEHVTDLTWMLTLPQTGSFVIDGVQLSLSELLEHLWDDIRNKAKIERALEGELLAV